MCVQVQAGSLDALTKGNFRLRVQTASRSAGTMTGRFWHILPEAAAGVPGLPTVCPGAELAQLSFHPSRVAADPLARAPQVLPKVVSVGEFRGSRENVTSRGATSPRRWPVSSPRSAAPPSRR